MSLSIHLRTLQTSGNRRIILPPPPPLHEIELFQAKSASCWTAPCQRLNGFSRDYIIVTSYVAGLPSTVTTHSNKGARRSTSAADNSCSDQAHYAFVCWRSDLHLKCNNNIRNVASRLNGCQPDSTKTGNVVETQEQAPEIFFLFGQLSEAGRLS